MQHRGIYSFTRVFESPRVRFLSWRIGCAVFLDDAWTNKSRVRSRLYVVIFVLIEIIMSGGIECGRLSQKRQNQGNWIRSLGQIGPSQMLTASPDNPTANRWNDAVHWCNPISDSSWIWSGSLPGHPGSFFSFWRNLAPYTGRETEIARWMKFRSQSMENNIVSANLNPRKSHHRQRKRKWYKATARKIGRPPWAWFIQLIQFIQSKLFRSDLSVVGSTDRQRNTHRITEADYQVGLNGFLTYRVSRPPMSISVQPSIGRGFSTSVGSRGWMKRDGWNQKSAKRLCKLPDSLFEAIGRSGTTVRIRNEMDQRSIVLYLARKGLSVTEI
jgi:hypothetical protein